MVEIKFEIPEQITEGERAGVNLVINCDSLGVEVGINRLGLQIDEARRCLVQVLGAVRATGNPDKDREAALILDKAVWNGTSSHPDDGDMMYLAGCSKVEKIAEGAVLRYEGQDDLNLSVGRFVGDTMACGNFNKFELCGIRWAVLAKLGILVIR